MPAQDQPDLKQRILECFTDFVAERGYAETSFADLAAELGVSKGTLVHHFGSKLEMLRTMHLVYMAKRTREAKAIVADVEGPADQLSAMIYALILCHRDDRNASRAFTREIMHFAEDPAMADVRELRDAYTELVADIVRRGIEDGIFHDDDPRLLALQVLGMCNWAWTWFRPSGRLSAEEVAATFARTFLVGLSRARFNDVLADPAGPVPRLVRRLLAESAAAPAASLPS